MLGLYLRRQKSEPLALETASEDLNAAATTAYRDTLSRLAEQAQSEYDKAVMTLSGGALGISFGYLKDIAGPPPHAHTWLLVFAWLSWTVSVFSCLFSQASSASAMRLAIAQLDLNSPEAEPTGGTFNRITQWLNRLAGGLFVVGTLFMIVFAVLNQNEQQSNPSHPTAVTQPTAASPTGAAPHAQNGPAGPPTAAARNGSPPQVNAPYATPTLPASGATTANPAPATGYAGQGATGATASPATSPANTGPTPKEIAPAP